MTLDGGAGTARWWDTAPDVEASVPCSGAVHRLRWSRGHAVMVDHPDRDAEEALVALGGPTPACLDLVRLWDDAVTDGGFLEEWVDDAHLDRARLSWLGTALERLTNEGFHEFFRSLPAARAERMGRFVHRFPRPWLDRAAATVAESIVEGPGVVCGHAPALIGRATTQRVRRAFAAAVGGSQLPLGAAALVPLRVEIEPRLDAPPTAAGSLAGARRSVAITVAPSWLYRVWAAGAPVVEGRLVLDLRPHRVHPHRWAATVEWIDGTPRVVDEVVHHDGETWRVGSAPSSGSSRLGPGAG